MLLHLRIKAHFRYSLSLTANEQRHKEARPSITRKSFFFDVCFAEQFHFLSTFGFVKQRHNLTIPTIEQDCADERCAGRRQSRLPVRKLLTTGLDSLTSAAARTS